MEKIERQTEEASYLGLPFHFLNQTLKAILRCLGILHHDPPTVTKTSSDSAPLNQPVSFSSNIYIKIQDRYIG